MTDLAALSNHLLIAMPSLQSPGFEHSVIYICEHVEEQAVGLIINQPMIYPLGIVFEQLNIEPLHLETKERPLLYGGPVQPERGFVIHKHFGDWRSSLLLSEDVTITTSNDIIQAIANEKGPKDVLVTLGYSGWSDKQLEHEIMSDFWLVCPYKSELLYEVPFEQRWSYAGSLLGVNMNQINSTSGHA